MWKSLRVVSLALLIAGCAAHTVTSGRVQIRDDQTVADVRFSSRDRAAIERYYRPASPKRPPGSARRDSPPNRIARRDILPPGLQGRALPRELEARLTALPAAHVRVSVGRDILLLQRDTRVVLDILPDAIPE